MWQYTYQDELYHYGVKGMKWGVRKEEYDSMTRSQRKKTRKEYKQDEKWKKKTISPRSYYETWSKSVDRFNSELPEINKTINGKSIEQTNAQYVKRFNQIMKSTLADITKSTNSPSGRYKVEMFMQDLNDIPYMSLFDNKNPDIVKVHAYL